MKRKNIMISAFIGIVFGVLFDRMWMKKLIHIFEEEYNNLEEACISNEINKFRYKDKWDILVKWKNLAKQKRKAIDFLIEQGYRNIAIYGLGELGEFLAEEVIESKELNLKYIIDQGKWGICYRNIPVINLESELEHVDGIVITTVRNFEEVKEQIEKKKVIRVIALSDLLDNREEKGEMK